MIGFLMANLIPHSCHLSPWQLFMSILYILRDILCCFPDYPYLPDHSASRFFVTIKLIKIHFPNEILYVFNGFKYVSDK